LADGSPMLVSVGFAAGFCAMAVTFEQIDVIRNRATRILEGVRQS